MKSITQTRAILAGFAGFLIVTAFSLPSLAHNHGAALQECAQQAGVSANVTDPSQLTPQQGAAVQSCMQQKFAAKHAKMAACMKTKIPNWQPGPGPKDPATQAARNACRQEIHAGQAAAVAPASVN